MLIKSLLHPVIVIILIIATFAFSGSFTKLKPYLTKIMGADPPTPKAFPGAEGFGSSTPGGRGGTVMEVINLNDSGSGSFRDCAEALGPRICVFRIGGTIEVLNRPITIQNPNITIAGQTAPGGGITLRSSPLYGKATLKIKASNVIIRGIRVRSGAPTAQSSERRGITIEEGANNIIIDHSSVSWATDENMTVIDAANNLTVQWSIISEGLSYSTHPNGEHSKGFLISGDVFTGQTAQTKDISIHHNIFAHNRDRNPRNASWGLVDFVNNVVYNWGFRGTQVTDTQAKIPINVVNNYYKAGVDTATSAYEVSGTVRTIDPLGVEIYVIGNIGPHRTYSYYPDENVVHPDDRQWIVGTRFSAPGISTHWAQDLEYIVLPRAGVTVPRRDSVDERIVSNVTNGTGSIINDPLLDVGGWPTLEAGTPPVDTDHDGMPDDWEIARGLNPNVNDSGGDRDGDGYTNIEEYINGLITMPAGNPCIDQPDGTYCYPIRCPQPGSGLQCQDTSGICQEEVCLPSPWTPGPKETPPGEGIPTIPPGDDI